MSFKGVKRLPPLVISKNYAEKMVKRRMEALRTTTYVPHKIEPGEVDYFLTMLDAFDKSIRPTIDPNVKVHGNYRYSPIQMYEAILTYLHLSIENGRNITMGHLAMFCGMRRTDFTDMLNRLNRNAADPAYDFLHDCMAFVESYIEYKGQDKQNPAFQIFWLKNRGWKDKFEIEASSTQGALTAEEREAMQKRVAQFSEVIPQIPGK